MMPFLERKEPVISYGTGDAMPPPRKKHIERAPRYAPTGDLTRGIIKERFRETLERRCHGLNLSRHTFEALLTEVTRSADPSCDGEALGIAMRALFGCEPIMPTTPHPILLVGGAQATRMRVALALSQRTEWAGRRVALYSMQQGRFPTPLAIYAGGLDILKVGSVDACIDAVRAREPDELAIIDASCLDEQAHDPSSLPRLTLGLNAEAVYVDDGNSALPDSDRLQGVERIILSGRPSPAHFGALLDMAHAHDLAFAGQCARAGIYHPMTQEMLAERFAQSIHQSNSRSH